MVYRFSRRDNRDGWIFVGNSVRSMWCNLQKLWRWTVNTIFGSDLNRTSTHQIRIKLEHYQTIGTSPQRATSTMLAANLGHTSCALIQSISRSVRPKIRGKSRSARRSSWPCVGEKIRKKEKKKSQVQVQPTLKLAREIPFKSPVKHARDRGVITWCWWLYQESVSDPRRDKVRVYLPLRWILEDMQSEAAALLKLLLTSLFWRWF